MSDGDANSDYYSLADDDTTPNNDTTSNCDTLSDNGTMSEDDMLDSPPPIFDPEASDTEVVNPLGKEIRIRIDIDGCKGLPPMESGEDKDLRRSWYLKFEYSSSRDSDTRTYSSRVYEGNGIHRGTAQWNEALYINCLGYSPIFMDLYRGNYKHTGGVCVSIEGLLRNAEIILWPNVFAQSAIWSTLHLSASQVLDNRDKGTSKSDPAEVIQCDDRHNNPANLWNTVFCQFPRFTTVLSNMLSETDEGVRDVYWIQSQTFESFKECQERKSPDPKLDKLLTDMGAAVNVVRQSSNTLAQHKRNVVKDIIWQLYELTVVMFALAKYNQPYSGYSETELARLIIIIGTPDPTFGAGSTSASTNWHIISGTITKDALLFALEAIVQSADAFPPLKSAASGLLFFATCADTASSNKKQIRDIYRRVESLAASLNRGAQGGDLLAPAHQDAIAALAHDIATLNEDVQDIIAERKSRFKRFFSAKRHREELKEVVNQLEVAKSNYMLAMATLNGVALAEVRGHVKAMTLVMDVNPAYALGTRRADAVAFPTVPAHIEEV